MNINLTVVGGSNGLEEILSATRNMAFGASVCFPTLHASSGAWDLPGKKWSRLIGIVAGSRCVRGIRQILGVRIPLLEVPPVVSLGLRSHRAG